MALSWLWSDSTSKPSESDAASSPTPPSQAPSQTLQPQEETTTPIETPATPAAKSTESDLPKLWTPQTNKKLFFGGALFLALSLLTTRRALHRRHRASIPPYYTSSLYHKPEVNGGFEAFEALHLATINVLSFSMMASGGVLWALGINGIEDMRGFVRKRMVQGSGELTENDKEMEREVEEWVVKTLGKRIEGGKLVDAKAPSSSGEAQEKTT